MSWVKNLCRAVPCRAVPCRAVPCRAVPRKSGTRTKILAVPCPKRYTVNGVTVASNVIDRFVHWIYIIKENYTGLKIWMFSSIEWWKHKCISLWVCRRAYARNVRLYYSVSTEYQPFSILFWNWTLPTQHTTFIFKLSSAQTMLHQLTKII